MGIDRVRSWYDFWCQVGDLYSSMKYRILLFSFVALLMQIVNSVEWTIIITLILTGRVTQYLTTKQSVAEAAAGAASDCTSKPDPEQTG